MTSPQKKMLMNDITMPMKKSQRKKPTGARRRPALRRPRRAYPTNVNRSLQPIPQRYIAKMKYSESITTDATGNFQFNLNSIFDPNRSGVGHQPYGHDTFLTLYNRYRVIACGWRINALLSTAANPVQIGCMPANEVITFTSISELREQPRAKYITQNPGAATVTLTGKQYIPSLVGRTKEQYMADDRYQAQMGASPSELAILNLVSNTSNETVVAQQLNVLLEFTVEFFDIKHLAQS